VRGDFLKNPVRFADGKEPAEAPIGGAVLRIAKKVWRAIDKRKPASYDHLHIQFARGEVGADEARHRIMVRYRDGGEP
jgi:hypothetical protein